MTEVAYDIASGVNFKFNMWKGSMVRLQYFLLLKGLRPSSLWVKLFCPCTLAKWEI